MPSRGNTADYIFNIVVRGAEGVKALDEFDRRMAQFIGKYEQVAIFGGMESVSAVSDFLDAIEGANSVLGIQAGYWERINSGVTVYLQGIEKIGQRMRNMANDSISVLRQLGLVVDEVYYDRLVQASLKAEHDIVGNSIIPDMVSKINRALQNIGMDFFKQAGFARDPWAALSEEQMAAHFNPDPAVAAKQREQLTYYSDAVYRLRANMEALNDALAKEGKTSTRLQELMQFDPTKSFRQVYQEYSDLKYELTRPEQFKFMAQKADYETLARSLRSQAADLRDEITKLSYDLTSNNEAWKRNAQVLDNARYEAQATKKSIDELDAVVNTWAADVASGKVDPEDRRVKPWISQSQVESIQQMSPAAADSATKAFYWNFYEARKVLDQQREKLAGLREEVTKLAEATAKGRGADEQYVKIIAAKRAELVELEKQTRHCTIEIAAMNAQLRSIGVGITEELPIARHPMFRTILRMQDIFNSLGKDAESWRTTLKLPEGGIPGGFFDPTSFPTEKMADVNQYNAAQARLHEMLRTIQQIQVASGREDLAKLFEPFVKPEPRQNLMALLDVLTNNFPEASDAIRLTQIDYEALLATLRKSENIMGTRGKEPLYKVPTLEDVGTDKQMNELRNLMIDADQMVKALRNVTGRMVTSRPAQRPEQTARPIRDVIEEIEKVKQAALVVEHSEALGKFGLGEQLEELSAKEQELMLRRQALNMETNEAGKAARQLSRENASLEDQYGRTTDASVRQASVTKQKKRSYAEEISLIRQLIHELDELKKGGASQKELDSVARMFMGEHHLDFVDIYAHRLNQLTATTYGIRRVSMSLQGTGREIQYFFDRMVQGSAQAVDAFTTLDLSTARAAAAMEAPKQMLPGITQELQNMAVAGKAFPAVELAEGMRLWAAGTGEVISDYAELAGLIDNVNNVSKLAVLNNTQLAQATEQVGVVMAEFNMHARETEHVVEVLNYVTAKSRAQLSDVLSTFREIGPIADELGEPFEVIAAAQAELADAGLKGSKAGRALRQIYIRMLRPTEAHNDAMNQALGLSEDLGTAWQDLVFPGGQFVGLANYIELLADATADYTDYQRASLLATMATANELPAITSLVNEQIQAREHGINVLRVYEKILAGQIDEEVAAYKRLKETVTGLPFSLAGAQQTMESMMDTIMESDAMRAEETQRRWETAAQNMGRALKEFTLGPMEIASKLAQGIAEDMQTIPAVAQGLGMVATAGKATGGVLSAAGDLGRLLELVVMTRSTKVFADAIRDIRGLGPTANALIQGGEAMAKGARAIGTAAAAMGIVVTASLAIADLLDKLAQKRGDKEGPWTQDAIQARKELDKLITAGPAKLFPMDMFGYLTQPLETLLVGGRPGEHLWGLENFDAFRREVAQASPEIDRLMGLMYGDPTRKYGVEEHEAALQVMQEGLEVYRMGVDDSTRAATDWQDAWSGRINDLSRDAVQLTEQMRGTALDSMLRGFKPADLRFGVGPISIDELETEVQRAVDRMATIRLPDIKFTGAAARIAREIELAYKQMYADLEDTAKSQQDTLEGMELEHQLELVSIVKEHDEDREDEAKEHGKKMADITRESLDSQRDAYIEYYEGLNDISDRHNEALIENEEDARQARKDAAQDRDDSLEDFYKDNAKRDRRRKEDEHEDDLEREKDYNESVEEAWKNHWEKRAEIQEQAAERLAKLEEDLSDRLIDLLEERDVRAIHKAVRDARRQREELNKENAKSLREADEDIAERLDDLRKEYDEREAEIAKGRAKETRRRNEDDAERAQDIRDSYAEQIDEINENERLKRHELEMNYQREKTLHEEGYHDSLDAIRKGEAEQRAEQKRAHEERLEDIDSEISETQEALQDDYDMRLKMLKMHNARVLAEQADTAAESIQMRVGEMKAQGLLTPEEERDMAEMVRSLQQERLHFESLADAISREIGRITQSQLSGVETQPRDIVVAPPVRQPRGWVGGPEEGWTRTGGGASVLDVDLMAEAVERGIKQAYPDGSPYLPGGYDIPYAELRNMPFRDTMPPVQIHLTQEIEAHGALTAAELQEIETGAANSAIDALEKAFAEEYERLAGYQR